MRGRCRGRQLIAIRREGDDGADAVGLSEQWRVALIGNHEHRHVGAACAHGGHSRVTQDIGIGTAHDHQWHLRHGVELRPQRRKRLVRVEALEGVGERGIVGAHEPAFAGKVRGDRRQQGRHAIRFWGKSISQKLSVTLRFAFETNNEPGQFVPVHVHPTQDEFIFVQEGVLNLKLDNNGPRWRRPEA